MISRDVRWMRKCIRLAERGHGTVAPNPLVGCVIVKNDDLVGEGWHDRYGGPHAEAVALAQAGNKALGATLYVSLEPCSHYGKTPPCTDAIMKAGIARVVVGMRDPHPEVRGGGIEILEENGISCSVGIDEGMCEQLNNQYVLMVRNVISGARGLRIKINHARNLRGRYQRITSDHSQDELDSLLLDLLKALDIFIDKQ